MMTEIEKKSDKKLNTNQMASLELLSVADEICRKHHIGYSLFGNALWGAVEFNGFLPWNPILGICMFYSDLQRFIEICQKEFEGTPYYLITSDNCEQFDELYIRVGKRSRVVLTECRQKDQMYYDYFLIVMPIFHAGNSVQEYRKSFKAFRYHKSCLDAFKIEPDTVHLKNLFQKLKRAYFYRHRSDETFNELKKCLLSYDAPTKYVLMPVRVKQKGVICLAETYTNLKEVTFEGKKFMAITAAEEWINDYFKDMDAKREAPINKELMEGPEFLRRIQLIELDMIIEFDRICRKFDIPYNLAGGTLLGAVRHGGYIPWDDDADIFMLYEDYVRFLEVAPAEIDSEKFFLRTPETDKDCNITLLTIRRNGTKWCQESREKFDTNFGIKIDILPLFNGSNSRLFHKIQFKICKFFKTMTWAHMGAENEKRPFRKWYYKQLARVSNQKSYRLFLKCAAMIKKETGKLTYVYMRRNPYNKPWTQRKSYEDLTEMAFEGHMFLVPKNYEALLSYAYGDYMRYPLLGRRLPLHFVQVIDAGNLYEFTD